MLLGPSCALKSRKAALWQDKMSLQKTPVTMRLFGFGMRTLEWKAQSAGRWATSPGVSQSLLTTHRRVVKCHVCQRVAHLKQRQLCGNKEFRHYLKFEINKENLKFQRISTHR